MKNLQLFSLISIMIFSIYGINSVKAQECSAILDSEVYDNTRLRVRAVTPNLPEINTAVTIKILVVYTPSAKKWAIQNGYDINNLIDQSILRSNQVLSNSQTNVTLSLVHKQEINYVETTNPNTDLARLRDSEDGFADDVHAIRSRYGAALVVMLLGDVATNNVLGSGYIMNSEYGNPKSGFSVVQVKTIMNGYTMIHEIGHNFGCGHHTDTDNNSIYSYAHGFKGSTPVNNKFSTVMSYENNTGVNYPRIPYFSDPNIVFDGANVGSPAANNAKTIRQTKLIVVTYSDDVPYYDAFLQDINVSQGILSPVFNAGIYDYVVNVDNNVTSIDIQGITNSPYARILSGNVQNLQLSVGDNMIEILVQDGWENYDKKYTVNVVRDTLVITGINEINDDFIQIYPNPAINELIIKTDKLQIHKVEIYDILGKTLFDSKSITDNSVDISDLHSGIYLIKILMDKDIITKKFVKK